MAGNRAHLSVVGEGSAVQASRSRVREPLAESRQAHDPIWVTASYDGLKLETLFGDLCKALRAKGCSCASDIQTEPHEGLSIWMSFEVHQIPQGKREPEYLGMVTLYKNAGGEGGGIVLRLSPEPGCTDIMREALVSAIRMGGLAESDFKSFQRLNFLEAGPAPAS
jgi:hypothetical protein